MKLKDIFRKKAVKTEDIAKTLSFFAPTSRAYSYNNDISVAQSFKNWSGVCIKRIASSISGIDNHVVMTNNKGEDIILNNDHWLVKLLKEPNRPQGLTWTMIKDNLVKWLLCNGNAYLYTPTFGEKYPLQIWILQSNSVSILPGKDKMIDKYVVQMPNGIIEIPSNEICHIKTLTPSSDYTKNYLMGTAISLQIAIDSIKADYEMKEFIKKHFENEALSPIILKGDFREQEEVDAVKSKIKRSGVKTSIVGAVNTDVSFETFPQTNIGTNTINNQVSSNVNAIMISAAFGVPYGMIDTSSQQNKSTAELNYKDYRQETIEPLMMLIEDALNNHFSQYEYNVRIKHDVYQYIDKENELEKLKLVVQKDALTINELRESYGLAKLLNGGDILTSDNKDNSILPTKELKKKV